MTEQSKFLVEEAVATITLDRPEKLNAFTDEMLAASGFTTKPIDTLGLSKAFRTCALFLDDFKAPVENRLGAEGDGFKIIMKALTNKPTGITARRGAGTSDATRSRRRRDKTRRGKCCFRGMRSAVAWP